MSNTNHELEKFIAASKEIGLSDEEILEESVALGWRKGSVLLALHNVAVPVPSESPVPVPAAVPRPEPVQEAEPVFEAVPETAPVAPAVPLAPATTTISAVNDTPVAPQGKIGMLLTVLHSVAVWVYLAAAVPAIGVSLFSLFTGNRESGFDSFVVAIIVAATLLLAITQVALLAALGKNREVIASKVFNVLTIAATVLSLVIIVTTLIVVLLTGDDHTLEWVFSLVALALIEALFLLQAYALAFKKPGAKHSLFVPIAVLSVISVLGLGLTINNVALSSQARVDTETSRAVADVAKDIVKSATANGSLPETFDAEGVTYRKTGFSTYELCADYLLDSTYDYYDSALIGDSYVSEYDFNNHRSGEQCFALENTYLADKGFITY